MSKKIGRTPPAHVRHQLRKEVGFGCPIPGCGNPYLSWHHFDPPWDKKPHHNPEGMIALCAEHHSKADVGAYTKEQLRELKCSGSENNKKICGRFDWMRNNLLSIVGGAFFYESDTPINFRGKPIVSFNRDQNRYLLLNVSLLNFYGHPVNLIKDNDWCINNSLKDLESPPSGKKLRAKFHNGDDIKIEFFELENKNEITKRYPKVDVDIEYWDSTVKFPVTCVEIKGRTLGGELIFGPRKIKIGSILIQNNFIVAGNTTLGLG